MRLLVMFDLPVKNKIQMREANLFRKFLIKDGYHMVQYSIYARICNGQDSVYNHKQRLKYALPKEGAIRVLTVTEKQYEKMDVLLGKRQIYDKNANYDLISFF